MESYSEQDHDKKDMIQENKNKKQAPFFKINTISFVRVGLCHMCKIKNKVVYQCHKNFISTSCEKKFCYDCLVLIYKDNVVQSLQKSDSWRCPYIRKVCRCKNCCMGRKEPYSVLELDPSISVYSNLRSRLKPEEDQEECEDENMRNLLREKVKRVLDFNGQLINKVNSHYHKLSEEEIKFYNKLIHSNLAFMNNTAKDMILHQTLIEE